MTSETISVGISGIDLSAGKYLRALEVGPHQYAVTASFKQLRSITHDPEFLQPSSKRRHGDDDLEDAAELHELVQRALAGNKKANVPNYRLYIERLVQRPDGSVAHGVLPPIHLWTEQRLNLVRTGDGVSYVLVPDGEYLISIDGETQLTAHYQLQRSPATPSEVKDAHKDYPLAVVIHHGVPRGLARQYFHDLNVLAVRPNTSLGLSMDTSDPLMRLVNALASEIPFLKGRVDLSARQLSKNSPKVVTLQALRQMVVNVAKGISGVQYGARPAPVENIDLDDLSAVARGWLTAYFDNFAAEVANRENYLAGSGTVLAAVGALGNLVLKANPEDRKYIQARILDQLRSVDWRKDDHWTGIAGAPTPKGVFSVKGTKETSYAVYNVLTDPNNAGYQRVRKDTAA